MSLILGSLAAYAAVRHARKSGIPAVTSDDVGGDAPVSAEAYLAGTDILCGASTAPVVAEAAAEVSAASGGFFWRAVGAGLVVAATLTAAEYAYAKLRGWPHFFDANARGY